jgi:hypothetical protein
MSPWFRGAQARARDLEVLENQGRSWAAWGALRDRFADENQCYEICLHFLRQAGTGLSFETVDRPAQRGNMLRLRWSMVRSPMPCLSGDGGVKRNIFSNGHSFIAFWGGVLLCGADAVRCFAVPF